MKLVSFRVRNFHSLIDSGVINLSDITALVGANQAGKSSILLGIGSISMDASYDDFDLTQLEGISKRFLDNELSAEEIPIVEAKFTLSIEEKEDLQGRFGGVQFWKADEATVSITKYYDGSYLVNIGEEEEIEGRTIRIPSKTKLQTAHRAFAYELTELKELAKESFTESHSPNSLVEGKFDDAIEPLNLKFTAFAELTYDEANKLLTKLEEILMLPGLDEKLREGITGFVESSKEIFLSNVFKSTRELELYGFLSVNLPRTVYYKSFDKLQDEAMISELKTNPSKNRTFLNLLKLSGLKIDSLMRIKNEKQKQAYIEQASGQATKLLRKAWKQQTLEIQFRFQGDRLMAFMKDSSAVETLLPPSSGSEGFQWFLGFFINFGALTNATYNDAILLLDDPGVYLHPSAHKDLLNLLEEYLTKNVTTIYSTHQPFLIPTDKLYRLRLVKKVSEGHSTASQKFYDTEDRGGVLLPLKAALSLTVEDKLVSTSKYCIVCQNPGEKIILEGMIREFVRRGLMESSNLDDLSVVGASSAEVAKMNSVLLEINDFPYLTLFDNDPEGRVARENLLKSEIPEAGLLVIPKEILPGRENFTLEDLFPESSYAEALDQVYGEAINYRYDEIIEKLKNGKKNAELIIERAAGILKSRRIDLDRVAISRELIRAASMEPEFKDPITRNFAMLFGEIGKRLGLWKVNYVPPPVKEEEEEQQKAQARKYSKKGAVKEGDPFAEPAKLETKLDRLSENSPPVEANAEFPEAIKAPVDATAHNAK